MLKVTCVTLNATLKTTRQFRVTGYQGALHRIQIERMASLWPDCRRHSLRDYQVVPPPLVSHVS
jgi:hypothetical protein